MKISRVHPFTGKLNTVDLPVTPEQLQRWTNGEHAQNVFPDLTLDQREFLISGITDWDEQFSNSE